MKHLTLILTLFFSTLMFASPAYADWEVIGGNVDVTIYVDLEKMRKDGDGYMYYWELQDLLKPNDYGVLSVKVYNKGDCEMFGTKRLSFITYKQPMGEGRPYITNSTPETEWLYVPPNSLGDETLKLVCEYAENL